MEIQIIEYTANTLEYGGSDGYFQQRIIDTVDVTFIINKRRIVSIKGLIPIEGQPLELTIINEVESWVK